MNRKHSQKQTGIRRNMKPEESTGCNCHVHSILTVRDYYWLDDSSVVFADSLKSSSSVQMFAGALIVFLSWVRFTLLLLAGGGHFLL